MKTDLGILVVQEKTLHPTKERLLRVIFRESSFNYYMSPNLGLSINSYILKIITKIIKPDLFVKNYLVKITTPGSSHNYWKLIKSELSIDRCTLNIITRVTKPTLIYYKSSIENHYWESLTHVHLLKFIFSSL